MYVRWPIYRKIRDVIQSCKINAVATFLGGMLRNEEALKIRKEGENVAKAGHIKQARKDLEQSQAQGGKKKEVCMAKHQNDKQAKLEDMEAD